MNLELKELVDNALFTAPDRSILTTSKQIDENFQQKTPEHYHESTKSDRHKYLL
ncbi:MULTISPECIES: hypothetical protein [unclassified Microcoleus]|uniref:hypothetical protein n=1 Tax=unclassified Microcoleus TaxID=2642155 RepID=UPI0025FF810C|nr:MULTISPECIES: hypothetical protein [unclassified Microcoleus]